MIILTMFAVLLLLLSINVPIAIGLAVTTIIAMVLKTGTSFLIDTAIVMFDGSMKFPLIAIPLFILAGSIMNSAGISRRLIAFASALVGFIKGGLSMINIATSMFFAEISGSAVADVAALRIYFNSSDEEKRIPRSICCCSNFIFSIFSDYYSTFNTNDCLCGYGSKFSCSIICSWNCSRSNRWLLLNVSSIHYCKT